MPFLVEGYPVLVLGALMLPFSWALLSLIWPIAPWSADQEPLIWSDPITIRLICFQPHPCKPCRVSPITAARSALPPSNIFHCSRPGWNATSEKSQETIVLRNLEQAMSEGFWTLSGFARSGFGRSNWSRPMQITAPHHRSRCGLFPDHPDRRADPGKQTTPRSRDNQVLGFYLEVLVLCFSIVVRPFCFPVVRLLGLCFSPHHCFVSLPPLFCSLSCILRLPLALPENSLEEKRACSTRTCSWACW